MMKRMVRAAVAATAALLLLAGCTSGSGSGSSEGGDAGGGAVKVAAFSAGYSTPAIKWQIDALQERAEAEGWEFSLFTSDNDHDKLNSDMSSAALQGFDAFVVGGADHRALGLGLRAAADASIPVFGFDVDPEANSDFAVDVVSDQNQLATESADALIESMGGASGKKVMIITFDYSLPMQTRAGIAEKYLTDAGVEIVQVKPVQDIAASVEESLNFVKDYLQANPDGLNGVWTGFDPAALGAAQGVIESGRGDVFVTGIDGMGAVVDLIAQGSPLVATMQQDYPTIVETLFGEIAAYLSSGELPAENLILVPGILVTQENAASVEALY